MKEPHLQLSTSCLPGLAGPPEPSRDPFDQLLSEHTDPLVRSVSSQHLSELPGSAGPPEPSGNSFYINISSYSSNPLPIGLTP